ncbi:XkdN-like protein [Paenibacillus sp. 1011MAR3C5]|uniref:phage tail assembly chaperone n=1 Tax=Paenibacillus sp. 1011MAR3C5 TaxID=1675787 RepID=UPI000E6BA725|nr:XkdN-like protein [Paenibacillus sp. 1011MAR3C5]RJE84275.1 XkdN-like protein [Paenibacillus sp. 1011MAR3C5]
MSTLQDFLNSHPVDNLTEEVVISDRFKGKDGKLMKFTIRAMSADDMASYQKRAMKINPKSKDRKVEIDSGAISKAIVINHTVVPNFKDAASIQKLGCFDSDGYLQKVLLAGEIEELSKEIQRISGYNMNFEELVDEAKN